MGRLQGYLLGASLLLVCAGEAAGVDTLRAVVSGIPFDSTASVPIMPGPLSLDPLGRVWMLDPSRGRIARLDAGGGAASSTVLPAGTGRSLAPIDIACSGTYLYALDAAAGEIALVDLEGQVRQRMDLASYLESADAQEFLPSRLLVGDSGDLWLLESRLGGILRFDRRMRFLGRPLDGLAGQNRPARIVDWTRTSDDGLILLDAEKGRLVPLDPFGGSLPAESLGGALRGMACLAADSADRRFVLDSGGRLRVFLPGGRLAAEVVLDPAPGPGANRMLVEGGSIWVADPGRGEVHRWRIDGLRPANAGR